MGVYLSKMAGCYSDSAESDSDGPKALGTTRHQPEPKLPSLKGKLPELKEKLAEMQRAFKKYDKLKVAEEIAFNKAMWIFGRLLCVTRQGSTDLPKKVDAVKARYGVLFLEYTSSRDATIFALSEALQKSQGLQKIKDSISEIKREKHH